MLSVEVWGGNGRRAHRRSSRKRLGATIAKSHLRGGVGGARVNVKKVGDTRLIAGVSVANNPLITGGRGYAHGLSEPYLFNHAMRSWLFAEAIGRIKGIDYDHEVVAIGTILHDIGLTASVSGPNRFEVNGADAALLFIKGKGLSDRRAQLIWDLVALNSTPSVALHKEPEVAVCTMGRGLDLPGFRGGS